MTLSTTTNTATYTGSAGVTDYSFPYLFYADGDLTVTVDGTVRTLNGAGTYDYTVTGAGVAAGGTVTFNNAPTSLSVVIQRIVDYTQETDFENFDGNPADVTEKQFDLVVMQAQQLAEQTDRTILSPIGTSLTTNTITGTIDSTTRVLTLTTSGPATATLGSLSSTIDTTFTSLASGDLLQYNGTVWVNISEIPTAQIADDAVTTAKVADNAVTFAKIADNFINSAASATVATGDLVLIADIDDSNNAKKVTAQSIADLAASALSSGYNARYFCGFGYAFLTGATQPMVANTLYGRPFSVGEKTTFTRIGINVTSSAAGNARLGIHEWTDGAPGALVLDAGTVSTGTTGEKEITISQELGGGVYCLTIVCDAAPTLRGLDFEAEVTNDFFGNTNTSGASIGSVVRSFTYAALPDPFGGALTYNSNAPAIWLRKA